MAGKKGCCLLRGLGIGAVVLVGLFLLYVWIDDDEDGEDYISEQEQAAAELDEDISLDELVDLFFDWYGDVPEDDNEKYNFTEEKRYKDYDRRDYEDYSEHRRRRGHREDYWDNYWDEYYEDFDNYYDKRKEYKNYKDYEQQQRSERSDERRRRWREYNGNEENYGEGRRRHRHQEEVASGTTTTTVRKVSTTTTTVRKNVPTQTATGSGSDKRAKFVACAKTYKGTPYVWGGTSHSGIDCSGLVYLAAKEAGLGTLPRTAKLMHSIAQRIEKSERVSGDLIFFSSGSSVSHVAIYLGNDEILHAVSDGSQTGVIVSKLSEKYWKNHYYASGRIIK